MTRQKISITQSFSAPVERVFPALADHNGLGAVLGVPVRRIRDGKTCVNGEGSIRRLGPAPLGTQETVTDYQENQRVAYRISKFGGPIRNHQGEVRFTSTDTGCDVTWTIGFDTFPALLGAGVRTVLETGIRRGLGKLARTL